MAVVGPTADLLPSSPGGERSRGFGDRNQISPLDALRSATHKPISFAPGVDRVGDVVPASALPGGLVRTQSDSSATQVDSTIDYTGPRTLTPGVTYTWTGKLQVPADDTYALWLQRTPGSLSNGVADPTGGRGGSASGPVALSVDGASQTLTSPSTILANTYPGGPTLADGQYEGLFNSGSYVALTKGAHDLKITFTVAATALPPVNLRFTWSPVQASIDKAVATAAGAKTAVVFVDDANTTGALNPLGRYQDQLVDAVANANPDTVVVLNTGDPVQMPWLDKVRSVVEMWYPGQEGGTATANVLLGRASVGGKLPISFPASAQDTPFGGHPERDPSLVGTIQWSEGLFMGYRWYDQQNIARSSRSGMGCRTRSSATPTSTSAARTTAGWTCGSRSATLDEPRVTRSRRSTSDPRQMRPRASSKPYASSSSSTASRCVQASSDGSPCTSTHASCPTGRPPNSAGSVAPADVTSTSVRRHATSASTPRRTSSPTPRHSE